MSGELPVAWGAAPSVPMTAEEARAAGYVTFDPPVEAYSDDEDRIRSELHALRVWEPSDPVLLAYVQPPYPEPEALYGVGWYAAIEAAYYASDNEHLTTEEAYAIVVAAVADTSRVARLQRVVELGGVAAGVALLVSLKVPRRVLDA